MELSIESIKRVAPKNATHYEIENGEPVFYAQDFIGRWCYIEDDSDCGWPCPLSDSDRLDCELIPLDPEEIIQPDMTQDRLEEIIEMSLKDLLSRVCERSNNKSLTPKEFEIFSEKLKGLL